MKFGSYEGAITTRLSEAVIKNVKRKDQQYERGQPHATVPTGSQPTWGKFREDGRQTQKSQHIVSDKDFSQKLMSCEIKVPSGSQKNAAAMWEVLLADRKT